MITALNRPSAVLRRAIAILISVVLALLLLAPSAGACERAHDRGGVSQDMAAMTHGAIGGVPDCGGHGESLPSRTGCGDTGSPGCPSSHAGACAAMAGCSTIAFVMPEPTAAASSRITAPAAPVAGARALSRASAPELPPPRA